MKRIAVYILWFPSALITLFLTLTLLVYMHKSSNKTLGAQIIENKSLEVVISPQVHPTQNAHTDFRIDVLKKFFSEYNSPLLSHIDGVLKASDTYGIDYALIPSISMQESGGCKITPPDSYNCWGYGIYGSKRVSFESYDAAMMQVAKTIKEAYIKKGLTNPTLLEDRWAASESRGTWSYSVNYFISKFREYEKLLQGT